MLCRWNELVGCGLDEAGRYRLRALEQVGPGRGRFATCLEDGSRGLVEFYEVSQGEAAARLRIWEELRAARCPYLLPVVDYGQVVWEGAEYVYLVTVRPEACLGEVLDAGRLEVGEMREIAAAVLGGLAWLHERGWAHGTVGPETVVAVGDRTVLGVESIGVGGQAAELADVRAVGRLLVAVGADAEGVMGRVAAGCLGGVGVGEALRTIHAEEDTKPKGELRKLVWAATAMGATVAAVVVMNGW
ncbi:MAG: hypothetical protein JNK87_40535 [Bryobacterales bacterium]|nr:hypothetical protein [Bryobacterales bacterium]